MWDRVKTFLLVTVITAMIWTFAEAESLTSRALRVEVAFITDTQTGRFIDVSEGQGWTGRAEVTFEGSTSSVGELESILRRGVSLRAGMEGVPSEPGEYLWNLHQALRAVPELDNTGVTLVKVDPPTLRIAVDTLVSRELKISADAPGVVVDGVIECKPAQAKLIYPATLASHLAPEAVITARVDEQAVGKLVPGRLEVVPGVPLLPPLSLAGQPRVRIEPDRAEVTLKLRSRTDSYTIASVPVHLKIAAGELSRWNIDIPDEDRFVRDVKVSGPSELVDRVRRGEIRVTAVLPLSFDELERGVTNKDVVFAEIPTDLTFDADRLNIRLKITKREAPDPSRPPSE
ncbi:MAG: hypothetical protein IT435_05055 [Phycisphaerales bacterium]|nr:hypothetical protein [Phycisphaerales bacterium]